MGWKGGEAAAWPALRRMGGPVFAIRLRRGRGEIKQKKSPAATLGRLAYAATGSAVGARAVSGWAAARNRFASASRSFQPMAPFRSISGRNSQNVSP